MHLFWEPVVWPLFDLVRPKRILEIGAEEGKHTLKVLPWCQRFGAMLHVVEPFPRFNVEECAARYRGHFELHRGFSPEALASLPPVDVALIDGDHNWYTVHTELETLTAQNRASDILPPILLLHDVDWPYGRRDLYYDPERIPEAFRHPWRRAGILPGYTALAEEGGGCNANYCNAETEGGERNGVRTAAEDFVAKHTAEGWQLRILTFFSGLGILICEQHLRQYPDLGPWLDTLPDESRADLFLRALEGERNRVLVELEKRRFDIAYLKKKREDAEAELTRLRERLARRESENEQLRREQEHLRGAQEALRAERDALHKQHETLREQHKTLRQQHETLHKQHETLREQHKTLRQQHETLHKQHETLHKQHETLRQQHETLRQQHETLHKQHETLHKQHETLHKQHETLHKQHETLRKQLETFKLTLDQQVPAVLDMTALLERRGELQRQIRVAINFFELAARSYARFLASWRWRVGNRLARWAARFRGGNTGQPTAVIRIKDAIRSYGKWKQAYQRREKELMSPGAVRQILADPRQWPKHRDTLPVRLRSEVMALDSELRQLHTLYERMHLESRRLTASKRWWLGSLLIGQLHRFRLPEIPSPLPPLLNVHWASFNAIRKGGADKLPPPIRLKTVAPAPAVSVSPVPAPAALSRPQSKEPTPPEPAVRLLQFTPPRPRNPFYTIMTDQLARWRWPVRFTVKWEEAEAFAREQQALPPVVHLHQLDPFYHIKDGDLNAVRERAEALLRRIESLRAAGAALVHTFHNPWPHNRAFLEVDRWFADRAMPLMDRIIVLCEAGLPHVRHIAPADRIRHIPHPHFINIYGPPEDRAAARRKFGFRDTDFVCCQIGEIKPYKGLERLLDAWTIARHESPDLRLLLAGRPADPDYVRRLHKRIGEGILLEARELGDSEIPEFYAAADAAIFSFEDQWVSSSVILALSYGVPAVVPDVGGLGEYVFEEDNGFLYSPNTPEALAEAILRARKCPWPEHLRYMCFACCAKWAPEDITARYAAVYREAVENRNRL